MSPRQVLDKLTSTAFLDELHHLAWIEPGENQGQWDEGWNCRDHAWLAGVVVQLFKLTAAVVYGQATFVQGANGDEPPVGLSQDPHAWLGIEGLGMMDLSPNLTRSNVASWRPWPLKCIAMNRCVPDGIFHHATSPADFKQRVAAATHSPTRQAIYHGQGFDQIDFDFVNKPFEFVNSPLSVQLSKRFDSTVYAKAAIHLFRVLREENKSLQHLPQQEAWEAISQQPGNAIVWLKMKGGIR